MALTAVLLAGCGGAHQTSTEHAMTTPNTRAGVTSSTANTHSFADDLVFLENHGKVVVLESTNGGRVAVSPQYQGRVMTSAVDANGQSLGFVHRAFIEARKTGTAFDNYGGEDRFWLGPEGGQFGLYFPPGQTFEFDHWQTPHALQEGAWRVEKSSPRSITFATVMSLPNWSGTKFDVAVERTVSVYADSEIPQRLGVNAISSNVHAIAFETRNQITNVGSAPWKKDSGLLSIWILAMYAPSSDARVVLPVVGTAADGNGPIVNDTYFGKVPAERLTFREDKGFLLFACDGKFRSKIGLPPNRAKSVLGSYSPSSNLLTIVTYDLPKNAATAPYVNSMWEKQSAPYAGDVVNSYNDGPPAPGKPSLGGFYELETSSPAAELAPKQTLVHTHRTFHFVGERSALEPIAKGVLGVDLAEVVR
jgi:hypothetical protein